MALLIMPASLLACESRGSLLFPAPNLWEAPCNSPHIPRDPAGRIWEKKQLLSMAGLLCLSVSQIY